MAVTKLRILVLGVLFWTLMYCNGFPTTLVLERVGSADMKHNELIARDMVRHRRIGVVNFPLRGSPDFTSGLYFTRLKVGNPPREYHVMIDTGSDITWINCNPCIGCPRTSELIELSFYDPRHSSSAAPVSCSDRICKSVAQDSSCSSNSLCSYSIPYGDGSGASGYYVSDMLHFDTITGKSAMANYSADIVFGCTNNQSGSLTDPQKAVDGIFGFGPHPMSVISQLASRGITPNVFSHCLKGEDKGGGILVLGEIVEPGIIYSPLVPSQPYYNLNLLSISISGHRVPIDPKVFATSENRGTIVNSGTTLAYLAEEAYDPFVTALSAALPPSLSSSSIEGSQCFEVSNSGVSSLRDVFPLISLNFAGGASMVLKPQKYLLQRLDVDPGVWCVGFKKNQFQKTQGLTILGDLILQDKIIVYDLARQRLGWADYNCSASVNVSLASPSKHVSSSSRDAVHYPLIPIATAGFIFYISMCFLFM